MSLTSTLRHDAQFRTLFKAFFDKPRLPSGPEIQAPPQTENYAMIGTAFDYLLRFEVARLNLAKMGVERRCGWIAEIAAQRVINSKIRKKAKEQVKTAREMRDLYISTGEITDDLLRSVINLARLDPIYRAGVGQHLIGADIDSGDIDDLSKLLSIVPKEKFKANNLCLLNPTFGMASHLVGGADADLVADDMIIDVKTTKIWSLKRRSFDQLLGYYTLHAIDGVGGIRPKPSIRRVSIYFSRFGVLHTFNIKDLITRKRFRQFKEEFQQYWKDREREQRDPLREALTRKRPPNERSRLQKRTDSVNKEGHV